MKYKTDHPFNQSGDSKLLRKKYAVGGPIAKGVERGEDYENPSLEYRREDMDHSDDPILELEKHRDLSLHNEPSEEKDPDPNPPRDEEDI
jgi:hypothetical protein